MKKAIKYIKKCDHFGAQIKLNLHHKETHRSFLGGSVTLLIAIAIIMAFIRGSISLINRQSYTIQTSQLLNLNPPLTLLTQKNFMIAFSVDLSQKFSKPLFKFFYQQYNQTISSNGIIQKNPMGEQLQFELCTAAHFNNFDETNIYNELLKNQLTQYFCLPLNYSLLQQGTYRSNEFLYGKLMIFSCLDEPECVTLNELNDHFSMNQSFKINTLMQNTLINLNQQEVIYNYIYSDFYIETNLKQSTTSDIYLQKINVLIDQSQISLIEETASSDILQIQDQKLTYSVTEGTKNLISELFIRLAQAETVYSKQYYRFDELISYIGGITKFIISLFGYFLAKYNKTGLQIMLANDLYQFDMPEEQKGQLKFSFQNLVNSILDNIKQIEDIAHKFKIGTIKVLTLGRFSKGFQKTSIPIKQYGSEHLITNQSTSKRNALLTEENLLKSEQMVIINPTQKNKKIDINASNLDFYKHNFLEQIINIILEGNKKLKYGVSVIIKSLICWRFSKIGRYKNKILKQSKAMIQKDMDILVIIQKLMEMEKLKHLLLSKDQLKVFNCLPKPIIGAQRFQSRDTLIMNSGQSFEKNDYSFSFRKSKLFESRHQFNTSKKLRKLYDAYESIKLNKIKVNEQEKYINQKLMDFVEPTIQHSFNSLAELQRLANISKDKQKTTSIVRNNDNLNSQHNYSQIRQEIKQYYFRPPSLQVQSKADLIDEIVIE